MHMFEIWKNLGTCISIYAVYPKPLLNHQTLILPITSVSVILIKQYVGVLMEH